VEVRRFSEIDNDWVLVGEPEFSTGSVDYLDFALDRDGLPLVVFRDQNAGGKATVMAFR
jgi:hypothetical protein